VVPSGAPQAHGREPAKGTRFHLDQHAGDLIARGWAPEEARRQARLALGGPERGSVTRGSVTGTDLRHPSQKDPQPIDPKALSRQPRPGSLAPAT
jgi:hypothetical protein